RPDRQKTLIRFAYKSALKNLRAVHDNSLPRFVPVLDVEPIVGLHLPHRNDSIVADSDAIVWIPMNDISIPTPSRRRRRFQRGSLQKRKSAGCWNWIVIWWQGHRRRGQILGPCSTMSRPDALAEMATLLQPVNIHAGEPISRTWTVAEWIRDMFLPLCRRKWKLSTASTTGDRIRKHLITDLGSLEIQSVTRELLQRYLEKKVA